MHPTISDAFSRARVAELHARADAHRSVPRPERRFSFRYAEPRDRPALERLAVLDGAERLGRRCSSPRSTTPWSRRSGRAAR
jgi:hypothetical protein